MIADRILGGVIAVLALAFVLLAVPNVANEWLASAQIRYYTMSPRLFPYIAGTLCLLLGGCLALKPDGTNRLAALRRGQALRNVLLSLGIVVLYGALVYPLGFVGASILALAAFLALFGPRRWLPYAIVAVGVPVLIKWGFQHFFLLELPRGPFGLPF